MRNIKHYLCSFLVIISFATHSLAQEGEMLVYHVTGKASVKGKLLQKGNMIQSSEIIDLTDGSSLVLVCQSFQVINVNKKGKYPASGLISQCNTRPSSFTASYFKYVWKEFTHKHGSPDKNPLDYMTNVGAVNRGMDIMEAGISLDTIHYYKGELPIRLLNLPARFTIKVYNDEYDGGIEAQKSFSKSKLFLNSVFENLSPGVYYWQVSDSIQNLSSRKYVKIWEEDAYQQEIERLLKNIPQTTAAETAFVESFVLAENNFLQAAYTYLKLAATLDANNKTFIHVYDKVFF